MILTLRDNGLDTKLICFPYAAGFAALFRSYLSMISMNYDVYAIEYPGRNKGLPYSPLLTGHQLCLNISQSVGVFKNKQLLFLGISMGGYIAFKVAQILKTFLNCHIKKVIMISVSHEQHLKASLNSKTILSSIKEISEMPDQAMQYFLTELIEQDQQILKTVNFDLCTLPNSVVSIFNGEDDIHCHSIETESFWRSRTNDEFEYYTYSGKHIPSTKDMSVILSHVNLTKEVE